MLTIRIDCDDQRPKAHAALDGDLPQTVPELVFKADAGLVAFNSNGALRRALGNRNVRASLPPLEAPAHAGAFFVCAETRTPPE